MVILQANVAVVSLLGGQLLQAEQSDSYLVDCMEAVWCY